MSWQLPSWVSRWVTESPCPWVGDSPRFLRFLCVPVVACIPCPSYCWFIRCCWHSVIGIPSFDLLMLLPTPLPCWYCCVCFYCTVACIPAVTGILSCWCPAIVGITSVLNVPAVADIHAAALFLLLLSKASLLLRWEYWTFGYKENLQAIRYWI